MGSIHIGQNLLSSIIVLKPVLVELFRCFIAQSGFPVARPMADGDASAHDVILKLLVNDGTAADADSAQKYLDTLSNTEVEAYLRSKSAAELLKAYDTGYFGMLSFPYIFEDGTVIPKTGFDTFENGTYPNKVPLIIRTNKEETKLFLFLDPSFTGKDELYQTVASYSSDLWKAVGAASVARELSSHTGPTRRICLSIPLGFRWRHWNKRNPGPVGLRARRMPFPGHSLILWQRYLEWPPGPPSVHQG